jgi:two-component system, chemotaxis family, protein-glutamate methylesterase/glutaminase
MSASVIRVLLVDDSPLDLAILQRIIDPMDGVDIVATASSGREALELIARHLPDVVCTDYMMPEMDGLELTKQIMATHPTPILAVSSVVDDPESAFPILQAGALDFFPKPMPVPGEEETVRRELAQKLRILSKVYVFRRRPRAASASDAGTCSAPGAAAGLPAGRAAITRPAGGYRIALVGASTGGPQAVQTILAGLPGDYAIPVCLVQHISAGFVNAFATWLDKTTPLRVRLAKQNERPTPGHVYVAPEDAHLEFGPTGVMRLTSAPLHGGHRPSVTVAFESAAAAFGSRCIAALLTGMGVDGADGMRALADAGAMTLAQNAETCVVYGMPRAAVELGAARHVLSPPAIADTLVEAARS